MKSISRNQVTLNAPTQSPVRLYLPGLSVLACAVFMFASIVEAEVLFKADFEDATLGTLSADSHPNWQGMLAGNTAGQDPSDWKIVVGGGLDYVARDGGSLMGDERHFEMRSVSNITGRANVGFGAPLPTVTGALTSIYLAWVNSFDEFENISQNPGEWITWPVIRLNSAWEMGSAVQYGSVTYPDATEPRFVVELHDRTGPSSYDLFFGFIDNKLGEPEKMRPYLVVTRYDFDATGVLVGQAMWVDPNFDDIDNPDLQILHEEPRYDTSDNPIVSMDLTVYGGTIRFDNLVIATTWEEVVPQAASPDWAGFAFDEHGYVDTGDWMGLIYPQGDYIYNQSLSNFLYLPHEWVTSGTTTFAFSFRDPSIPSLVNGVPLEGDVLPDSGWVDTQSWLGSLYMIDSGWAYSERLEAFIWIKEPSPNSHGAWINIWREMPSIPLEFGYDFQNLLSLPPIDESVSYGEHLKRTMHLLSTSTEESPNKLKILFYGQSITRQEYSQEIIEAKLRYKYPSAQLEVLNPAIGGYGAPRCLQTMHHTLIPEQPDLVVFHVYGGEDDGTYEEIIRQIRSQTSAELVCITHHLDNYGSAKDAQRDEASQLRRDLAEKYDTELVEVREQWRAYMAIHDLSAVDLLRDNIHHNTHGGELWGALQSRHFEVQPADPSEWQDIVQRIDLRESIPASFQFDPADWEATTDGLINRTFTSTLTIPFEGSRVDAITGQTSAKAEILIDGKKPSELLSTWAATLPSPTPIDYRPAIMRVILHGNPIKEQWTVEVEFCSEDGREFSYSVYGSISGFQGSGDHTGVFYSTNGVIELRPEWFTLYHAIQIKKKPIPTPFEITWNVYPMARDLWFPKRDSGNPSGQKTLIQGLPDGAHNLEINLLDGDVNISELLIYRNRLQ